MLSCQREENLQHNHTNGICSGDREKVSLPRTASMIPSHKQDNVYLGGEKKEDRQDSLLTILCSSYCQVTYHTAVKHVRLAKSCRVI